MQTEGEIFACNLDRLMFNRGLSNARLAKWLGKSREMVGKYRSGRYMPSDTTLQLLCKALNCTVADLFTVQDHGEDVVMMPITKWAHREEIPVTRAKDLFTYGILQGAVYTEVGSMIIPETIKAPDNSKWLVRIAKVRPPWVTTFWKNFPIILARSGIQATAVRHIAKEANVTEGAVYHWNHKETYPSETRLPDIARALGCTIDDLTIFDSTALQEKFGYAGD